MRTNTTAKIVAFGKLQIGTNAQGEHQFLLSTLEGSRFLIEYDHADEDLDRNLHLLCGSKVALSGRHFRNVLRVWEANPDIDIQLLANE